MERSYDAIVLDLDGTLLDERGHVRPRNRERLRRLEERGVAVMVATGRSAISAMPIVEQLGLRTPAVVFNGAAVWCPVRKRLVEERVLSNRTFARARAFVRESDYLAVVMCAGRKLAVRPRHELERAALKGLHGLELVAREQLDADYVVRVTWFSDRHGLSEDFAREIEERIDQPVYTTHFPLRVLPDHRASPMQVVDVHPPCRGKGEALRYLEEELGIRPERVVAVGDATNDLPMFAGAGLSVCMESGMAEALAAAERVIGGNDTDAIAELVDELFGVDRAPSGASAAPGVRG